MKKFKIRRGVDLIDQYNKMPQPRVLWNGIVEGACGLITGVGKTGKTTFAENLAMSFAVGKNECFGFKIYGGPKKVLFINLEEKLWRIGKRNSSQIKKFNKEELKLYEQNYFTAPEGFPEYLNDEDDWTNLYYYTKEVNPDIIFLDSLTHMCIGEIEKSAVAQQFTKKFKRCITSLNKTVFVIHHNTKGNDKPMTQDNIAGSRIIIQEFDFALGFANIPTASGGTYSSMLYNKDAEKSNNTAMVYSFDKNYWIENLYTDNVYELYKESKKDARFNSVNKDLVYDSIAGRYSQGSQASSTRDLKEEFVWTKTISKQSLHDSLNKLIEEGKIERMKGQNGMYLPLNTLKTNKEDEEGNNLFSG